MDDLTKEQIENWRKMLVGQIGPWALMMPDEEVQALKDRMIGLLNEPPFQDNKAGGTE